jgi:hypothetical protein
MPYRRREHIGAVLPREPDLGVEGADLHDQRDAIEVVKSVWNIHYCLRVEQYINGDLTILDKKSKSNDTHSLSTISANEQQTSPRPSRPVWLELALLVFS